MAAYDITYNGSTDMYLCKFNRINTLSWGTYVGGSSAETFNDLKFSQMDGLLSLVGGLV